MPYRIKTKNINGWRFSKNRCMILGIRIRIMYDFLVIIQGSYMISLVSYKDRTKKSSMDSMKSYMILVWNQRNFNPGYCNWNKENWNIAIAHTALTLQTVRMEKITYFTLSKYKFSGESLLVCRSGRSVLAHNNISFFLYHKELEEFFSLFSWSHSAKCVQ